MKKGLLLVAVVLCAVVVTLTAKELKVAVGLALPPYIIENTKSGLEVDILKEALAASGHTIKLEFLPFARVPITMKDKTVDCALTINESSGITAFYSDSHIAYQNVAISLKSKNVVVNTIADLKKYKIVAFQDATKYLGNEFSTVSKTSPEYKEIAQQDLQVKQLFLDRTDVIVMDINIYKYYKQQIKDVDTTAEVVIHKVFPITNYKVGFLDKTVCDEFNKGLKSLKDTGKYNAIFNKYIK